MKGKKYIVPLLIAGVTAGYVTTVQQNVTTQVQAATEEITNIEGALLTVGAFEKDSYSIGEKVYLPTVTTTAGYEAEFTVTKGNKSVEIKEESGNKYFVANYVGYYNVAVKATKDGAVVSKVTNLSVWVEKAEAVINLPTNSEYVIPAKMPTSQEGFKIPAPTVTITQDDEEVTKKASELSASELVVSLTTPSKTVNLTIDSSNSYYAVNKDDLSEAGTYQIVYEYRSGNTVISRLESNFQVVSNYDTSKINLTMTFLGDVPSTGNVNSDITIPKIKVTDSATSTDSVNSFIQVTVTKVGTNKEVAVDYDNYTIHPTEEGYYAVTYKASIPLFGTSCTTNSITSSTLIQVKDSEAPVVIPTYAYTFNNNGEVITVNGVTVDPEEGETQKEAAEKLLVNRKVDIPSAAQLVSQPDGSKYVEVTIPAAYATDNFYTYKGSDNDEITIVRSYRTSTGAVSTITTAPNENATIKFTTKGNSEIRYKATDKAGNTLGEVVYDIVIYDTDADLSDGETKFTMNISKNASITDKEKTFVFKKPTATDTYDSNVEVKTFYKANGTGTPVELTETNDNGEYEIDVTKLDSTVESLSIYSEAYLDETLVGTRTALTGTKKVTSDEYTLTIVRSNSDTTAPTIDAINWNNELMTLNGTKITEIEGTTIDGIDDAGYALDSTDNKIVITGSTNYYSAFDQGNTVIEIPSVKFTDAYSDLSLSLTITDNFGNEVSKVAQEAVAVEKVGDNYEYTISGATFKLSSYGVYTVTFAAQDLAGNISVKSYGIRVNDKTAPTITIDDEDKFSDEIEVGEYFRIPAARLVKNGETIDGTVTWDIYKVSDGAKYTKATNGFTPLTEGTFFIRYTAVDEFGNSATLEDDTFTITAKDTVAPTIEYDLTYHMPSAVEWNPETDEDYMNINFPIAIATDKLTKKDLEVVYTVTGPNGAKPTVYEYADSEEKDYMRYFKATSEGTYTIKYYAIDDAGNETTITRTIAVGDCEAPTLTWKDQENDLPTEIKLNEYYTLNLSDMLTLSDNKSTESNLREKLTVTLTGPDGTTVTNKISSGNGYQWQFTSTGTYTLKFVVTDEVGNSNTYSYSITVPSEDAEEKTISPVLGTVLVVLSLVVLSGVVVYLVASSKKGKSSKKVSKKNKDK